MSRSPPRSLSSSTASCSRSSTGALRCETPATKSGILSAVLAREKQRRAQRERESGESQDRDGGESERSEGEDATPGGPGPQDAQEQPRGQERKAERERAIGEAIEGRQRRQRVVQGAWALGPELSLLEQVHQRAGEVENEGRNSHESQPDVYPHPGA